MGPQGPYNEPQRGPLLVKTIFKLKITPSLVLLRSFQLFESAALLLNSYEDFCITSIFIFAYLNGLIVTLLERNFWYFVIKSIFAKNPGKYMKKSNFLCVTTPTLIIPKNRLSLKICDQRYVFFPCSNIHERHTDITQVSFEQKMFIYKNVADFDCRKLAFLLTTKVILQKSGKESNGF